MDSSKPNPNSASKSSSSGSGGGKPIPASSTTNPTPPKIEDANPDAGANTKSKPKGPLQIILPTIKIRGPYTTSELTALSNSKLVVQATSTPDESIDGSSFELNLDTSSTVTKPETTQKVGFDDYETLPTSSVSTHMAAGAIAGIMEHCVMYPLDSVKTRMQSLQPSPGGSYRSIYEALNRMVTQEGIFRPVRGMSVVVVGAGPAHALYFSCYEKLKTKFTSEIPSRYNHFAYGAAGCVATLFHDGVMTPADVVKQRMQMYNSPYKSCWECVAKVYRTEGLKAFYRSYTTQLTMNVPFQSLHFVVYEFMTTLTNKERVYNPLAHMVSGAMAGGIASAITTPLDVCKTLLNTQEATAVSANGNGHISGLKNAFTTVYRLGGVRGYFQGVSARVLYQMPSTAICWSVYEFFKYMIQKGTNDS